MKALVVDPSAAVRRIASRALESLGCEEIIEAQDGASALTLLDAADVQLVLTEWSLPGGGGHEWIEKIRSQPALASASIAILTRNRNRGDVREAVRLGAAAYLLKPIGMEALRDRLAALLPLGGRGVAAGDGRDGVKRGANEADAERAVAEAIEKRETPPDLPPVDEIRAVIPEPPIGDGSGTTPARGPDGELVIEGEAQGDGAQSGDPASAGSTPAGPAPAEEASGVHAGDDPASVTPLPTSDSTPSGEPEAKAA